MPGKKSSASIYLVSRGTGDALAAKEVAIVDLEAKYTTLLVVPVHGKEYLFGYNPAQDHFDIYEFTASSPWLKPVAAKPAIGKSNDIVNTFTLGNMAYIAAYTAKNGVFEVYSVASDLSFSKPYEFYRNHELAVSKGFSTLKPFVQFGQVAFLGYRTDTGYVAMYTVSTQVSSPAPGVPPIVMLPVWAHPWAPGWTRFAFFLFGGEPFFLKTNVANPKKLNVNIDHVLDALPSGTSEVGTLLQNQLPDALELTNVEPCYLGNGDPYFATYIATSGAATLNRIHGDCLGWTQAVAFKAPAGASVLTPVSINNHLYLVFA
jgi:hypothetical protein